MILWRYEVEEALTFGSDENWQKKKEKERNENENEEEWINWIMEDQKTFS